MIAILTEDIRSHGRGVPIYGKKGAEITIISWHGDVAIVEGKNGDRYPVRKEFLQFKQ